MIQLNLQKVQSVCATLSNWFTSAMREKFCRINEVESTVRVGRQLEKASSNQLTELETNCVIQPSLLCLRLRVSLATRIFGKPRWSTRPWLSGRVRAASSPCASSAAAAECNIMICGRLPTPEPGLARQRHLDWFKAGSVRVCVVTSAADDQTWWLTWPWSGSVRAHHWSQLAQSVGYSWSRLGFTLVSVCLCLVLLDFAVSQNSSLTVNLTFWQSNLLYLSTVSLSHLQSYITIQTFLRWMHALLFVTMTRKWCMKYSICVLSLIKTQSRGDITVFLFYRRLREKYRSCRLGAEIKMETLLFFMATDFTLGTDNKLSSVLLLPLLPHSPIYIELETL